MDVQPPFVLARPIAGLQTPAVPVRCREVGTHLGASRAFFIYGCQFLELLEVEGNATARSQLVVMVTNNTIANTYSHENGKNGPNFVHFAP